MGTDPDSTDQDLGPTELEQYRTLVEAAGDLMYALDEEGYITLVNEEPAERLGYTKEELLGSHVGDVFPEEAVERGTERIVELLADPETDRGRFEFHMTGPDGEDRVFEDRIAVQTDAEGEFTGSVGVIRDITEERRQQAELQRQNERLEEFAGVVSHDLRNPLQVARGYLEQAERTGDPAAFAKAREAHERMETMIEDVLELARQGQTVEDTEHTDLETVAREAWGTVDTESMTLSLLGNSGIEADPDRLRSLFENLFRNSLEHGSPAEGDDEGRDGAADDPVTVRVGPLETMHTTTRITGDAVRGFYVADDGPGIPEEDREAVFEPGFSTDPDGTGFGLAIVREIAEAHGWAVELKESRDGGTRFEFTEMGADGPS